MPVLRPVPIATKNRSFFARIRVWLYEVRKWELVENWEYQLEENTRIILHKGFKFDGASIPRPLWSLLNPIGLLLIPGLIHDYGYRYQHLWRIDRANQVVKHMKDEKKGDWDRLFWRVGRQVNGTWVISLFAFLAVFLCGRVSWCSNRKKNEQAPTPSLASSSMLAPQSSGPPNP